MKLLPGSGITSSLIIPVYAGIDVGSNNVRMDSYGIDAKYQLKPFASLSFPCKLAEGMSEQNIIRRENLALALGAMKVFDATLAAFGIKPENTVAVMTEAVRSIENTNQGSQDIAALVEAFGGRKTTILRHEEEALLVGETVRRARQAMSEKEKKRKDLFFAAIGGGSVELGILSAEGEIRNPVTVHLGIHPLMERCGGDPAKAAEIFTKLLDEYYPKARYEELCVIGGTWRALGESLCGRIPARLEGSAEIRRALGTASHREVAHYKSLSGSPAKRALYMPVAAAALGSIARHAQPKNLSFLDKTIRDTMVHTLHELATRRMTSPPRGLERLFSPLSQAQALRA